MIDGACKSIIASFGLLSRIAESVNDPTRDMRRSLLHAQICKYAASVLGDKAVKNQDPEGKDDARMAQDGG